MFDVSLTELFGWFMGAGRLVILEPGQEKDPMAIFKVLLERHVTHINFVPSMCTSFVELVPEPDLKAIRKLKYVMVAGETFPMRLALESQKKFAPAVRIENIYGPTEISIYGTWFSVNGIRANSPHVPIGSPLYNVQAYVLSQFGSLLPIGVPGELYIGGAGLAQGYLNQPELTAEKFCLRRPGGAIFEKIAPPGPPYKNFLLFPHLTYSPIYRTGDSARWLPDGNIEFLGRIDQQVKIRGFRIECGEIEAILTEHPHIQKAVVMTRTINNTTQLVAYYAAVNKDQALEANEIKSNLQGKLPGYMIPTVFVPLETIPLTPSGKVDRKVLLKQKIDLKSSQEYAAPRTETEKQLTGIWEEILGIDRVGIYDNFFELGGHSLLALQMVAKIRQRLGIECEVKNIFDYSTVSELAVLFPALPGTLTDNLTQETIPKKNIKPNISIPLSNAQFIFWLFWALKKDTWNIYRIYDVNGPLDSHQLEQAFNALLQRHESPWARFSRRRPVQKITPPKHISLSVIDLRDQDSRLKEKNLEKASKEAMDTRFDFNSLPLIRLCLVQLEDHQYKMLLVAPHIVMDDVGLHNLFDELMDLYQALVSGQPLPAKRTEVQVSDYVFWEHEAAKQALQQDVAYWQQKLEQYSFLHVPDSYLLPPGETSPHHQVKLDTTLLAALTKISQQHKVSLQMSLSAVIAMVLHHITLQSDILISSVFENRLNQDLKHLVSPVATFSFVRISLTRETSFVDLVTQIKQTTLEAYEHLRSSSYIPLSFLYQNRLQERERAALRGQERVLRFLSWLLTRLVFPKQAYPTMFYVLLTGFAQKMHLKRLLRGKKHDSKTKSNTDIIWDDVEVGINFLPNFHQNPGTSEYICGDVTISPGTLPFGDSPKALGADQGNALYFAFNKDHEGHPQLSLTGMKFTTPALQHIAASFGEVLKAVVKNPGGSLLEM